MKLFSLLFFYVGLAIAMAIPNPVPHPKITAAPRLDNRDIGGFFHSVGSGAENVWNGVTHTIANYVTSGIPQFFQDLPEHAEDVISSIGLGDIFGNSPVQVLNLP